MFLLGYMRLALLLGVWGKKTRKKRFLKDPRRASDRFTVQTQGSLGSVCHSHPGSKDSLCPSLDKLCHQCSLYGGTVPSPLPTSSTCPQTRVSSAYKLPLALPDQ